MAGSHFVVAHDEPTSFLNLRLRADGISASLRASVTDLAHDLPATEPAMLLDSTVGREQLELLFATLNSRLAIFGDGMPLEAKLRTIKSVPNKRDVRVEFHYPWRAMPASLRVQCRLFPYDSRHQTFLNLYESDLLQRQEIFAGDQSITFAVGSRQNLSAVAGQFVVAGMHHIFIGPDHILFVVGLLLLGGTLRQLLMIVTAFTIAHSITLGLATFDILSPPASLIEPAIALSIVFVGLHAYLGSKGRDPRLLFAFGFGLIHGFGFASVLREMVLPPHALGWALFAFNGGVEIGQACIVLVVAPLLAAIRLHAAGAAERIIPVGALTVTAAGAFWLFQRVLQ
jgi:hydrogenase/urease accessory protein HupE